VKASTPFDAQRALQLAAHTFEIEAQALLGLKARQGEGFAEAVRVMLECNGRVVVTGIGKSGHVARKIAATLASTGTPSFFVHPAEASHGDLGMVTDGDIVLALSNSGEADELVSLLPALKRLDITLIAMTGKPGSTLARHADIVLNSGVDQEACPLNLAPTASTTAQMALGDALAVALLDLRGFKEEDFARSHPGGALGRKLLTHVRDLMRSGETLPLVAPDTPFTEMMHVMTRKGLGAAVVTDGRKPAGIFTDGDLRRLIEGGGELRTLRAHEVMHADPKRIRDDALAVEAAELMEQYRITLVLVVDANGDLVGALSINDLMRAKVI
jgi:arabinose-5-phosphate isomerase